MIVETPAIDYAGLSPIIALSTGLILMVIFAVFDSIKRLAPALALLTLATTAGLLIWQWDADTELISGTLKIDGLAVVFSLLILIAATGAVLTSIGDPSEEQVGRPDFLSLLMASVLGMVLLTMADNLIIFFVALELFSIPLYALCGTNLRRRESLESGFKYLVIGSVGSATLLYGMALIYGASAATGFEAIAAGLTEGGLVSDSLTLVGVGLISVGLAFKISIAPFHQWTPDVYQGAPTPVTGFMSAATKLAAFAVFIRFFMVALGPLVEEWDVILAVLATLSILIGNVGAIAQTSLKRMLGYSGVAQAGYMLAGIVVATQQGVDALTFYLAAYLAMNMAAFSAIIIHERQVRLLRLDRVASWHRSQHACGRLAADHRHARPRRPAADRRIHRQALPDRGAGRSRLDLARRDDRDRHDDLARLLHACGGDDLDVARLRALARGCRNRTRCRARQLIPTPHAAGTSSCRPSSEPPPRSSSASFPGPLVDFAQHAGSALSAYIS